MTLTSSFSPIDDLANVLCGYAILFGQFLLRDTALRVASTNLGYLFVGKFCHWVSIAMRMPSLLAHVVVVIFARSQKQVIWITTFPIVAFMENPQPIWNIAIYQHPCKAMGANVIPSKGILQLPVAALINRRLPLPAFIVAALIHLLPETLFKRTICRGLMTANVLPLPTWEFGWRDYSTTAAFAKDGNLKFHLRATRAIIRHVNVSLLDLTTPPDACKRCGGNSIGLLPEYFSTSGLNSQACGGAA